MTVRLHRSFSSFALAFALVAAVISVVAVAGAPPGQSADSATVTYTATQTLPVPPASSFAGSGGGDGWGIALSSDRVFNVFHHQTTMNVACHLQSDASACWPSPERVEDASNNDFATTAHPGLWLDQATQKLYVFGTRTSDITSGVVCIDTVLANTSTNPFCGFTALTAVGEGALGSHSSVGAPVLVGNKWYAFNYVNSAAVTGTKNKLMCFDTATKAACAGQPYVVDVGAGVNGDSYYPTPGVTTMGSNVVLASTFGGQQRLSCFDTQTNANCAGTWPTNITGYASAYGAPFPMLTAAGVVVGVCLPTGTDPCFNTTGASVATPGGMAAAVTGTSGWSGQAVVLGSRVYIPDGNANAVSCFDYGTNASCANYPKSMANLNLLYSVNVDPQRPSCLWVNADGGSAQIQNFDAYTGGACGQGGIRVLANQFVAPAVQCQPATYTSLEILDPARNTYTNGMIAFQDLNANPIPGIPDKPIDATGKVDLQGLNLTTALGLPQFLITLDGAGATGAVTVKLTWTGIDDAACVGNGVTKTTAPTTPVVNQPVSQPAAPVPALPRYTG